MQSTHFNGFLQLIFTQLKNSWLHKDLRTSTTSGRKAFNRDVHESEIFRTVRFRFEIPAFEPVRSRFEQSNSSDSSDSSNSSKSSNGSDGSNSSDGSDHSRRSKPQNRWLRLTKNSKRRIRTQQTTLFNGIWYFGVFENAAYEFDVKIQN